MKPVGEVDWFDGDVTTLNWIDARPPFALARNLGFDQNRLARGYWIILLCETLTADDFIFSGTTLRSGGRLGLPAHDPAADRLRPHTHDQILQERGQVGYEDLQKQLLKSVQIHGPNRIAKVIPVTRHDSGAAPDLQYPPGGGGLQWTLKNKKKFLIALQVDANGTATTPKFSVSLAETQSRQLLLTNRMRVAKYLSEASQTGVR
jgi:hypothetical protein